MFQAANANHVQAKLEGASLMLNKEMQVNHPIAIKWLNELIRMTPTQNFSLADIFKAYYLLGISYENGYGVRPNQVAAFKHYAMASILNGEARLALAKYFIRGTVVKKDLDAAFLLMYSAYLKDRSLLEDIAQIVATVELVDGFEKYLVKQTEYGDSDAYYLLGSNMLDGKIFAYQRLQGLTYLKKSVEMNNPYAYLLMAKILQEGEFGEEQDVEKAQAYYKRAFYDKRTQKEAVKYLIDYSKEQQDYETVFDYYTAIGDYNAAKEILLLLPPSEETESKDLFLKVKEYQRTLDPQDPKSPQLYQERLRMAANAGYPAAAIEYAKLLKDYAKLIEVMEQNVRDDDPLWCYELSMYYRAGGEANKRRNADRALYYLEKSAEYSYVPALYVLEKAYRTGNSSLNIKADAMKQQAYARKLLD